MNRENKRKTFERGYYKGLASQKQRSAQDDRMLELLNRDGSYVSPEKLSEFLQWYREGQL